MLVDLVGFTSTIPETDMDIYESTMNTTRLSVVVTFNHGFLPSLNVILSYLGLFLVGGFVAFYLYRCLYFFFYFFMETGKDALARVCDGWLRKHAIGGTKERGERRTG